MSKDFEVMFDVFIYLLVYLFIYLIILLFSFVCWCCWLDDLYFMQQHEVCAFFPTRFQQKMLKLPLHPPPNTAQLYSNLQPVWNVYFSFSKQVRKSSPCLFLTLSPSDCNWYNYVNHTQLISITRTCRPRTEPIVSASRTKYVYCVCALLTVWRRRFLRRPSINWMLIRRSFRQACLIRSPPAMNAEPFCRPFWNTRNRMRWVTSTGTDGSWSNW